MTSLKLYFLAGYLTACPMLGMILGSYFWGCLGELHANRSALCMRGNNLNIFHFTADTKGRKYVLIAALMLDGICGVLSSMSQIYALFMFFRFFNGFG